MQIYVNNFISSVDSEKNSEYGNSCCLLIDKVHLTRLELC